MNALKKIFVKATAKAESLMTRWAARQGFALLEKPDMTRALDLFSAYPAARQMLNGDGYTPLESLLYAEKWELAQRYLDYIPDDAKAVGRDGKTLVMQYASLEKTRAVDLLLGHGAVVDAQDTLGNTALHYTMHNEMDADMLPFARDLLRYGANPNIPNDKGVTPLMLAAENPALQGMLKLLLSEKADPVLCDKTGLNAAMHAVQAFAFGNAEMLGGVNLQHHAVQKSLDASLPSHAFARELKDALKQIRGRETRADAKKIAAAMQTGAGNARRVKTVSFRKQA